MRRIALALLLALLVLALPAPALAFAHGGIQNPWLHLLGDVATIALLALPIAGFRLLLRRLPARSSRTPQHG